MRDRIPAVYRLIGQKVRSTRKFRNMSQAELALLIAVSRTSVVLIELGKQFTPIDRLYEIAKHLNVPITWLLPNRTTVDKEARRMYKQKYNKKYRRRLKRLK